MGFDQKRVLHSLEVANFMQEIALMLNQSKEFSDKMFLLGYLHDIGYKFTNNDLEHPVAGSEILKMMNFEYWEEVREHGNPNPSIKSFVLEILNIADMMVDNLGNRVSVDERLHNIEARYGKKSIEFKRAKKIKEKLNKDIMSKIKF